MEAVKITLLSEIDALLNKGVRADDLPLVNLDSDTHAIYLILETLRYRNDPMMYDRVWREYLAKLNPDRLKV